LGMSITRLERQSLSMAGPQLRARKHVSSPSSLYYKHNVNEWQNIINYKIDTNEK